MLDLNEHEQGALKKLWNKRLTEGGKSVDNAKKLGFMGFKHGDKGGIVLLDPNGNLKFKADNTLHGVSDHNLRTRPDEVKQFLKGNYSIPEEFNSKDLSNNLLLRHSPLLKREHGLLPHHFKDKELNQSFPLSKEEVQARKELPTLYSIAYNSLTHEDDKTREQFKEALIKLHPKLAERLFLGQGFKEPNKAERRKLAHLLLKKHLKQKAIVEDLFGPLHKVKNFDHMTFDPKKYAKKRLGEILKQYKYKDLFVNRKHHIKELEKLGKHLGVKNILDKVNDYLVLNAVD